MITQTTVTNDDEDEGGNGGEVPDCTHNWVEIGRTQYVISYQCSICNATYEEPIQQQEEYGLGRSVESVETERHDYIYASGRLMREVITTTDAEGIVTTEVLDFTYDASGSPYTLTYNGTTYYYVVNLQGDVIRLVSVSGATVAEYAYDPWGRVTSASGTMAEANPLRYRGYYYDAEMEFYYLQSRYYDPAVCRFINADGLVSTGQGFLGYNMFAYCHSNPVCFTDPSGYIIEELLRWVLDKADEHIQEMKEEAENEPEDEGTVVSWGGSLSFAFALAGTFSGGWIIDSKGNLARTTTVGFGGGFPNASIGGYVSVMGAPSIYATEGVGTDVGASISPYCCSIGGEYNVAINSDRSGPNYQGGSFTYAIGFFPFLVESHGLVTFTSIYNPINLYDLWDSCYTIATDILGG